jgi:hypothetical protein
MKSIVKKDNLNTRTPFVVNSNAEIDVLKNRITELEALVKYYEEQFRLAKHKQFGASSEKSEYDVDQINLFNEAEATASKDAPEPELVEVEKHYRKRKRCASDRLPDDLPVEVIEHKLPPPLFLSVPYIRP